MKKLLLTNLIFLFFLSLNCTAQLVEIADGKQIDERLVGTWEGSEKDDQMEGLSKKWTMVRNADGTFELDFTAKLDGEDVSSNETGTWWIEDGKFHEYHEYSDMTDIYDYEILSKTKVKFKSVVMAMDMNTESYEFIDHKVKDKKSKDKKSKQDGLSFETAIKAKSVAEEYEFVRANCPDCKLVQQSLTEHKEKPYDVLLFKKSNGEEIIYYFDISSFYGNF